MVASVPSPSPAWRGALSAAEEEPNVNEADVYILAERAFTDVVDRLPEGRWEELTPPWLDSGRRRTHSLRELLNYHAYDTAWVPDTLAGRTIEEVGATYDGDLLGSDPRARYHGYAEAAIAAAQALGDPERIVHLTYGDFPAREYLKHITSFRTFRAYDVARWLGLSTELPEALVRGFWEELLPDVESWRAMGVYGPAVPVPEDAPLQDRLLGLAGRDPRALTR
jgi:uncharacterized protein (TIGR03086 family)